MDKGSFPVVCAIALNYALGSSPRLSSLLRENFNSAEEVFALKGEARRLLFHNQSELQVLGDDSILDKAQKEYESLRGQGVSFLSIFDPAYPPLLKECPDAPILLYIRSSSRPEELFRADCYISIVGTRQMDRYGRDWTRRMVYAISRSAQKCVIVSGLAIGADITAHLAALEYGLPTIAVSPVGIDTVYPSSHRRYAETIARSPLSAIVTDYPCDTIAYPGNFLRRNRIIAGLAHSTILIESRLRGGGMMTCRLASSYNRQVFALPGRLDDALSQGCNSLIDKNIAYPIFSIDSLLENLGLSSADKKTGGAEALIQALGSLVQPSDSDILSLCLRIVAQVCDSPDCDIETLCVTLDIPYSTASSSVKLLECASILEQDLLGRLSIREEFFCPSLAKKIRSYLKRI